MQTRDLNNRLVACVGDSIVRGDFSFNFVNLLKTSIPRPRFVEGTHRKG